MVSGRKKERKQIKCEGRFHEIREHMGIGIELLMEADPLYRFIRTRDLEELLDLLDQQKFITSDSGDPYYGNVRDTLRANPAEIFAGNRFPLSLVPLIAPDTEGTANLVVSNALHLLYAQQFGTSENVFQNLLPYSGDRDYTNEGVERLDRELKINMSNIIVPTKGSGHVPLSGYKLAAGFGVGPNGLGTLVYDTPYHIELHVQDSKADPLAYRTKESGVLGIGFWLNPGDEMLVAQIQPMRGGKLPEGVELGVAGLYIAEVVARASDFKRITAYAARSHPQFLMHPGSERQMMAAFRQDWDHSAKKLGYTPITKDDGTKNTMNVGFEKNLSNGK